jgi:hypothetical protein
MSAKKEFFASIDDGTEGFVEQSSDLPHLVVPNFVRERLLV